MKKLRITIEGRTYDVTVEELDGAAPPPAGPAPAAAAPAGVMTVRSRPRAPDADVGGELVLAPFNGTVVSLAAEEGRAVAAGEPLLIVESMKLHMPVSAPRAGTVSGIRVKAGDVIEEGQLLLLIG